MYDIEYFHKEGETKNKGGMLGWYSCLLVSDPKLIINNDVLLCFIISVRALLFALFSFLYVGSSPIHQEVDETKLKSHFTNIFRELIGLEGKLHNHNIDYVRDTTTNRSVFEMHTLFH